MTQLYQTLRYWIGDAGIIITLLLIALTIHALTTRPK